MLCGRVVRVALGLLLVCHMLPTNGQNGIRGQHTAISVAVVDENGVPVPDAQVTVAEPGLPPLLLQTDYLGRSSYSLRQAAPYEVDVDKPGFYRTLDHQVDPELPSLKLVLAHQQIVRQEVNVTASVSGIDPEQTSGISTLSTPEIVNIPYPENRDIRNILPFNPGVIQDTTGQAHVAGSRTYATLDLLDGFDIRSPASGDLSLRVSTDAVRSIEVESTRYPVEFGKATGGVIAYFTGMGDKRFRFNATDFVPSFRELDGLHFDEFAPRVTFSGPLVQNKAWFFDGIEMEYGNVIVLGLPAGANTDHLWRESNLGKAQVNLTPNNILTGGLLYNDYHSPYEGLSTLTPQESTTKRDTVAWLPYLRYQHSFSSGVLLDSGIAVVRFHDGYEPHGDIPFDITPETAQGSYFENLTGHSSRLEETGALYLPPRHLLGSHGVKVGFDFDQIGYGERFFRKPINYLREDGTLLRLSVFPPLPPFTRHNSEVGAYVQDRWAPLPGLVIEPGLRFDWDQIVRRPLYSPRLAVTYTPGSEAATKLSGGIGLYYGHTQLEYLERALAGVRYDTYYAADGVTPVTPPLETSFVANNALLNEPRALNWSVGIERKLPASIYGTAGYLDRRGSGGFVYANQDGEGALSGTYLLTNTRQEDYHAVDFSLRRSFARGYTLFGSYTHSSAHTDAALEYSPTLSVLGPQQGGPLPWDVPNRFFSWGWQPVPKLANWDFVYTFDWRTGFPFTSVDDNQEIAGAPGSHRFPDYFSFSPGVEWRFHLRGSYFGVRVVAENATGRQNFTVVNNVVDSSQYGLFSEPQGRAYVARIRLISSK